MLTRLTYAILPGKPVDPAVRGVLAAKNPFDFKCLCRRHKSAEPLDNQYGKMAFSSPA